MDGHQFVVVALKAKNLNSSQMLDECVRHVPQIGCVSQGTGWTVEAVANRTVTVVLELNTTCSQAGHWFKCLVCKRMDQSSVNQGPCPSNPHQVDTVPLVQV